VVRRRHVPAALDGSGLPGVRARAGGGRPGRPPQ
jgi:hypothetical protein